MNPCSVDNDGCDVDATCSVAAGGTATYGCSSGYSGDGKTCAPVDGYAAGDCGCDVDATCTSTGPGTVSGACDSGFTGDGKSCSDALLALDANLSFVAMLAVGAAPATGTLTLRNQGSVSSSGSIGSATFSGPSGDLYAVVASSDAGACQPYQVSAPGASCTLAVTLNPARAGILLAALAVGATPGGSASATLNGAATSGGLAILAASNWHSCAVVNGGVHCWCENEAGELGDGTATDRSRPVVVAGLSNVLGVSTGAKFGCAVTTAGVQCWTGVAKLPSEHRRMAHSRS